MVRRYVLSAMLLCLMALPNLIVAYDCIFDASGYYPDENLQYCKSHGCYSVYYSQKDCLSDCCLANLPGEYFKDRPELEREGVLALDMKDLARMFSAEAGRKAKGRGKRNNGR